MAEEWLSVAAEAEVTEAVLFPVPRSCAVSSAKVAFLCCVLPFICVCAAAEAAVARVSLSSSFSSRSPSSASNAPLEPLL